MTSDADLNATLDAFDEPVLLVAAGRTIAANRAARDLLGQRIVDSDVRFALRQPQALESVLAGRRADVPLVGIGGQERPWTMLVRPLRQGRLLVRLVDRSKMVAAERMRVDFVANASHELRTPLATILGYAETLAEAGEVPESVRRRFAGTIHGEAGRMLRIIEDLMGLSRIEADRFVVPRERVDLAQIARRAAGQIGPLAERKACAVVVDAPDEPLWVRGDAAQLLQVADNFLSNAIRYGCNQDCSEIRIAAARDGDRVAITVSDRGDGIAPEHLPRLTERFYRVDAARSRDSGGTGLGLAIAKHIVERHRGTLDIRSQPGKGTVVTATFPSA